MKTSIELFAHDDNEDMFVEHDYDIVGENDTHVFIKKKNGKRKIRVHKSFIHTKEGFNIGNGIFKSDLTYFLIEIPIMEASEKLTIQLILEQKILKFKQN